MSIPDSDDDSPLAQTEIRRSSRQAKDAALANKAWLVDKPQAKAKADPSKGKEKTNKLPAKSTASKSTASIRTQQGSSKYKPAMIASSDEDEEDGEDEEEDDDVPRIDPDGIGGDSSPSEDEDEELDDQALLNEKPKIIRSRNRKSDDDQDNEAATPPNPRQSKTLSSTPPAAAANLFNDDTEVAVISSPLASRSKSRQKRARSVSPAVEDLDDDNIPAKHQKKSRRNEDFKSEKPRIKALKVSPIKRKLAALSPRKRNKAASTSTSVSSPSWPDHATLIYAPGTKSDVPLLRQHPLVRRIARHAIKVVTERLVLVCAWEKDTVTREGYGAKVLRDACRAFVAQYPEAKDVYTRLKEDDVFASHLSSLPMDRLSSLRAPAKAEADVFISYFKLGLGEECKIRVAALFQKHSYIFPGKWVGSENTDWVPESKKPYGNPAIVLILKAGFFRSPTATGSAHADRFPVHDGKREMPKSLLALAATGIYASLYQLQQGSKKQSRFHGNSFAAVYNTHMQTLDKMEKGSASAFHRIMSDLYLEVCGKDDTLGTNDDIYSVCELSD